jgi:hypothetical protein
MVTPSAPPWESPLEPPMASQLALQSELRLELSWELQLGILTGWQLVIGSAKPLVKALEWQLAV